METFFLQKGRMQYVMPRYRNICYHQKTRGDHFGFEDVLYHCQVNAVDIDMENLPEFKELGNRMFTVYSDMVCETLIFTMDDIKKMGFEFPRTAEYMKSNSLRHLITLIDDQLKVRNKTEHDQSKQLTDL